MRQQIHELDNPRPGWAYQRRQLDPLQACARGADDLLLAIAAQIAAAPA
jgi:hypothetical protein